MEGITPFEQYEVSVRYLKYIQSFEGSVGRSYPFFSHTKTLYKKKPQKKNSAGAENSEKPLKAFTDREAPMGPRTRKGRKEGDSIGSEGD